MTDAPFLPPALLLTQQPIGGSGKSFTSQIAIDAATRAGIEIKIFENDGQSIFEPYGGATRIDGFARCGGVGEEYAEPVLPTTLILLGHQVHAGLEARNPAREHRVQIEVDSGN